MFTTFKKEVLKDPRSEKLNFEPDGRNHYVYRVSNKYVTYHYCGSKTEDKEDSIGVSYYTSSNNIIFKNSFKKHPNDWEIKIVRRFNNPGDKILFESYLHQKLDVKNHPNFINLANQTPFGFDTTGTHHSRTPRAGENPNAKVVLYLNEDNGEIVKEFSSIAEAGIYYDIDPGAIQICCAGTTNKSGDKVWCYKSEYNEEFKRYITDKNFNYLLNDSPNAKPIYKISITTKKILDTYGSAKEAVLDTGISNIVMAAGGFNKTAGGYIWCYVENYNAEFIKEISNYNYINKASNYIKGREIFELDLYTGKVIDSWDYPAQAAKAGKAGANEIKLSIDDYKKTAGNRVWCWQKDYNDNLCQKIVEYHFTNRGARKSLSNHIN